MVFYVPERVRGVLETDTGSPVEGKPATLTPLLTGLVVGSQLMV